ncbi:MULTISPECIES: DUF1404 family protein [Acidianus]|uniref:DUF1404 domain-containing protein n=1 Tax=Candidatus Acidianus copahuensis TaxID=1160895 RepID=A0A031LTX6_9CREN|nr:MULTISPECIES: DUF1404 family protein [Acidianus]EZQ10568.1 hypothetical protein CM19_03815 [Candidatus Acidianus copahuensis]NON63598.1 DUF1404 family protein [Acidianus sp. RZ1]
MELRSEDRYLILGLVLIASSVNPFSQYLYGTLELAKFSFDMLLVWGSGLLGIWLYKLLYNKGGKVTSAVLSFNYSTKGILFVWIIAGSIVTYWYIPGPFDYSVINMVGRSLQIISFIVAGIIAGLGWEAMSNAWRSITLFSMFSMMAAVAEIFLEMASYYSTNYYPAYSSIQLVYTSYALFAMAAVPSTYYMVKILKDLDLF